MILEEIAHIASGNSAPQDKKYFADGKYPFVRVQDLGRFGKNPNLTVTADYVNDLAVKEKHLKIFPKGSILLPKSGVSTLLNHRAILGMDACVVGHLAIIQAKEDTVLTKWLYYYLITIDFSGLVSTTTLPSLPLSKIRTLQIPVPPLESQRTMLEILERADVIKGKREQANQMANKILQAVFLQMFGDPATNPKGWQTTILDSVCSDIVDCPHSTPVCVNSGIPLIRTPNIRKGYIDFEKTRFVSEEEHKKRLHRICPAIGDILYAREATFGNAGLVNSNQEFSIGQRIMLLRPKPSIVKSEFLVWMINSDYVYNQAKQVARGSTNPHVNVADVRKFKIIVPPIDLQDKFVLVLRKAEQIKSNQNKSTRNVDTLFASIMSKAFKGELVRDIDEVEL
jgi:type I restriction enzyme, S subunit